MSGIQIDKREWHWVLLVGGIALVLTSIPYFLGLALQTDERVFGGFVIAVQDGYSYLAKMRQGAEGSWLFHIAYTPEPHPGTLFFPFHLLLGKIATLFPGPDLATRLVWTYHGARLFFGMGLLLTIYRFLATFTSRVRVRRLAFLLITFGGGLGWLLTGLGQTGWLGSLPLDFILPEGFTFLVLYAFPHIALGRTLLLWGILFLLKSWGVHPNLHSTSRGPKWAILAGLAWLLMGLVVPFYVAVAWAVAGAMGGALALRQRRLPWREAGRTVLAGLLSAPIVIYSAWIFTTDPVYAAWSAQNLVGSPHPLHYLAAFGVPLALGLLAAPRAWREKPLGWVPLAWVAIVPFLVYLPFNLQRRLVEGVQVPLSLLAAWGIVGLGLQGAQLRAVTAGLLVGLSLTNGVLIGGSCMILPSRPAPIFRDGAEVAALDWLAGQVQPDDVVLAAYETGNYLPVRVGARVFVGHGPESVRADEKREMVDRFFDPATEDEWRRELLTAYGVDWLFWGPVERGLGTYDPHTAPFLREVYRHQGYWIFRVVR